MNKKEVKITLSGPIASGKFRMAYLIKKALNKYGIDVTLNEKDTPIHLIDKSLNEALLDISNNTTVKIETVQTNTNSKL